MLITVFRVGIAALFHFAAIPEKIHDRSASPNSVYIRSIASRIRSNIVGGGTTRIWTNAAVAHRLVVGHYGRHVDENIGVGLQFNVQGECGRRRCVDAPEAGGESDCGRDDDLFHGLSPKFVMSGVALLGRRKEDRFIPSV